MEQVNKADYGKPKVSQVPMQFVRDVAVIKEYGTNKYGSPDGWRTVEVERYIDAFGRHALAFLEEPYGVDEESGLPHLWHAECNAAFLSEMLKDKFGGGNDVAEVKFQKNSPEWLMFQDYYKLCQKYWEPEGTDIYWKSLVAEAGEFGKKYKDIPLSTELYVAFMSVCETKYKKK